MSPNITTASGVSTELSGQYDLDKIGIEFEYPVAREPGERPATYGNRSRSLRNEVGRRNPWDVSGLMTSDHVGAEIITEILPLHSGDPEEWYTATIEAAEARGYPFAQTGSGSTSFGCHLHLSNMTTAQYEWLGRASYEPWMRVFVCSSVQENKVDPWRHGGVCFHSVPEPRHTLSNYSSPDSNLHEGHYEWRLPEPVKGEHFPLIIEFLQTLEVGGPEAAQEFALRHVEQRDERLTAIHQYQQLRERHDNWPSEDALECDTRSHQEDYCSDAAHFLARLMGDIE